MDGLGRSLYHRRSMPGFDHVDAVLKRGDEVEVLYDPTDTDGNSHIWGLRQDGHDVIPYAAMAAWRRGENVLGRIVVGALAALCALAALAYALHRWRERSGAHRG